MGAYPDHSPQSACSPFVRTRAFQLPFASVTDAPFSVVYGFVIVSLPTSSSCAADCADPSGWFGTHDTFAAAPVGTTESAVTFGASGGVMVVTEFDLTQADARLPRFALTL